MRRVPEVSIERLDQSDDVGLLDVRVLAPLLILEIVVDAPSREFESLADVLGGLAALIITPNLRSWLRPLPTGELADGES